MITNDNHDTSDFGFPQILDDLCPFCIETCQIDNVDFVWRLFTGTRYLPDAPNSDVKTVKTPKMEWFSEFTAYWQQIVTSHKALKFQPHIQKYWIY